MAHHCVDHCSWHRVDPRVGLWTCSQGVPEVAKGGGVWVVALGSIGRQGFNRIVDRRSQDRYQSSTRGNRRKKANSVTNRRRIDDSTTNTSVGPRTWVTSICNGAVGVSSAESSMGSSACWRIKACHSRKSGCEGGTPARLGEGSAEEHAEISDAGGLRLGGRAGDGKGTGSVSRRWQGMLVGHGPRRGV